jgi:very-short-patch-repair endonuclease
MHGGELARERMDFLMLLSDRRRLGIEVDGKQHHSEGDRPSPRLYSVTVAEDRRIRLTGYEVYRFGG